MARQIAPLSILLALGALTLLGGCSSDSIKTEAKYPTSYGRESSGGGQDVYAEKESIFSKDGLSFFGGKKDGEDGGAAGLSINSYLWRAALDTVSFMPLASADPFGGVILTDWYAPESKDERFKVNVFILSKELRSDGLRVRVFKQVKKGGNWKDVDASDQTARDLEDTILTRARQLRIASLDD